MPVLTHFSKHFWMPSSTFHSIQFCGKSKGCSCQWHRLQGWLIVCSLQQYPGTTKLTSASLMSQFQFLVSGMEMPSLFKHMGTLLKISLSEFLAVDQKHLELFPRSNLVMTDESDEWDTALFSGNISDCFLNKIIKYLQVRYCCILHGTRSEWAWNEYTIYILIFQWLKVVRTREAETAHTWTPSTGKNIMKMHLVCLIHCALQTLLCLSAQLSFHQFWRICRCHRLLSLHDFDIMFLWLPLFLFWPCVV